MKTTTTGAAAGAVVLENVRATLDARAAAVEGWTEARQQGDETGAILAGLGAEREIVAGALLQPLLSRGLLPRADAVAAFGESATVLAQELGRLGEFRAGTPWTPGRGLSAGQADALRRMLLAVVTDPRLVLVRLAEQLRRMRRARELEEAERLHLAWETREIYAPLANRLGIWQLKWELEDLSFRHLEPAEYRRIAGWLNESRIDRERYIDTVIAEISAELAQAGIRAEVVGRPKHIYSIFRKMYRKNLAFEQVFKNSLTTLPMGGGKTSPISAVDVARAVSVVLDDPTPHIGQIYNLTGFESADLEHYARVFSEVLGRTIRYRDVPLAGWSKKLLGAGVPAHRCARRCLPRSAPSSARRAPSAA